MKIVNKHKGIILCVIVFSYFFDFLLSKYDQYIVIKVLNKATKSLFADITSICLIIALCLWTFQKIKNNFFIRNYHFFYAIILIIFYLTIRIYKTDSLLESYLFPKLKYFDILIIFGIIPTILFLKQWAINKNKETVTTNFINDLSVKDINDDILERQHNVLQVAHFIKSNKLSSSIAIGIVGAWGDGKTTFMQFLESYFEKDNKFIIVHFNSWLNISVNSIISDFFNTVEEEIKTHSVDISKEIKKYGKNVLSLSKNSTTETFINAIQLIPENSLSENFKNLNYLLNKLDKRVIVFLDDLDRLQPNEVFEVMKLIRNTASFDVFNYIVGYDKDYIVDALTKNNIPFAEKYCEKIFLKEFPLKPITANQINNYIKNHLISFIPEKEDSINKIFEEFETYIFYNNINIFSSVRNIRNAKGFLIELINIKSIITEVDLQDYILVKILKFSYYDTYRLLFNRDSYLVIKEDGFSGARKYLNYKLKKSDKQTHNFPVNGKPFEESKLKEELENLKFYNELNLKIIASICDKLFNKSNFSNQDSALNISYGNNYYNYFQDEIPDSSFTYSDFKLFLEADFDKKKEIIDKAYEKDKLNGLILFIFKVSIFSDIKSKSSYQDFLKSIFYIANLKSLNSYTTYYGFDFETLNSFLHNYKDLTVEHFNYQNVEELKSFYSSLFYAKREYYDFESDFVKYLFDRSGTNSDVQIPFTRDEMEEYLSYCFDNDSKLINGVDDKFWHCYRLCIVNDWEQSTSNSWSKSKKIIKKNREKFLYNIVPLYLDEFLVTMVNPQSFYGEDQNSFKVGIREESALSLCGSIKDFIDYLESDKLLERLSKQSVFKNEFINFAKEFQNKNEYINFNFSFRPILKKLEEANIKR